MIARMKHLDLVCVAAEKEATLAQLRDLGAVHLDLASSQGAAVASAKDDAADAEQAVRIVLKARKETAADGAPSAGTGSVFAASVPEILALQEKADALKGEAEWLGREIAKYEPYGDFDPALAQKLLELGRQIEHLFEPGPQGLCSGIGAGPRTLRQRFELPADGLAQMKLLLQRLRDRTFGMPGRFGLVRFVHKTLRTAP